MIIETEVLRMQESKISERNAKCFRKKAWIQNWYPTTQSSSILWRRLGSQKLVVHYNGRLENFIGFKFWGYYFVFLISCLFCFDFILCFVLVFYLGLRSLFVFLCIFILMLLVFHMLLSWVHLILPSFFQVKGSLQRSPCVWRAQPAL